MSYDPDRGTTPYDDDYEGDDIEIDEDEEERFAEDLEVLAEAYVAEQAEFNSGETQDEFYTRYGFTHNCRCVEDWQEGNTGLVTDCFLGMVNDAFETLAAKVEEVRTLERDIARLRIELAG